MISLATSERAGLLPLSSHRTRPAGGLTSARRAAQPPAHAARRCRRPAVRRPADRRRDRTMRGRCLITSRAWTPCRRTSRGSLRWPQRRRDGPAPAPAWRRTVSAPPTPPHQGGIAQRVRQRGVPRHPRQIRPRRSAAHSPSPPRRPSEQPEVLTPGGCHQSKTTAW